MKLFAAEAADGVDPTITIADGSQVNIATPMISKEGVHYRQLIQKFLSVAVTFFSGYKRLSPYRFWFSPWPL